MGELCQLFIGQRDINGLQSVGDLEDVSSFALIDNPQSGDQMRENRYGCGGRLLGLSGGSARRALRSAFCLFIVSCPKCGDLLRSWRWCRASCIGDLWLNQMPGFAQNRFQAGDKPSDETPCQAKDLLLIMLVCNDNQNAVFNL